LQRANNFVIGYGHRRYTILNISMAIEHFRMLRGMD
jgi:hypothetical protein